MRRSFSFIACLLAVLWLPATLHCGLETAGLWLHAHDAEAADQGCAEACQNEACTVVEDGAYKSSTGLVNAPAPVLALCLMNLVVIPADVVCVLPTAPERTESPPELARTWQFTARTALLPGAPSIA